MTPRQRRARHKARQGPLAYVLRSDPVRPRRRMILREDTAGLVHWAAETEQQSVMAVPYCGAQTDVCLVIFFFRDPKAFECPTCLWCAAEPFRQTRRL